MGRSALPAGALPLAWVYETEMLPLVDAKIALATEALAHASARRRRALPAIGDAMAGAIAIARRRPLCTRVNSVNNTDVPRIRSINCEHPRLMPQCG